MVKFLVTENRVMATSDKKEGVMGIAIQLVQCLFWKIACQCKYTYTWKCLIWHILFSTHLTNIEKKVELEDSK